ncbi:MAG: hypothetical protein HYV63_26220 [Candidatus Schekmanbacteria bacterium]|nr:hypothetical protein [Candidatus Schekmanbacteria bacterium]
MSSSILRYSVFAAIIVAAASPRPGASAEVGKRVDYTWAQCTAAAVVDNDHDTLDDDCEFKLAYAFQPRLVFDNLEWAEDRRPYWAVKPTGTRSARIFYALSYFREMDTVPGWHYGDTEFIVVQVEWKESDRWQVRSLFTSAHYAHTDDSGWADLSDVHWYGETLGRPFIFVALAKHANYVQLAECRHVDPLNGDPSADWCDDDGAEEDVQIFANRNLGNYHDPLNGTTAVTYDGNTEHFWGPNWGNDYLASLAETDPDLLGESDSEKFCGWQDHDAYRTLCVYEENSYLRQLCDFDFCDPNSRVQSQCESCDEDHDCAGGGSCVTIDSEQVCAQACDDSVPCSTGFTCAEGLCMPQWERLGCRAIKKIL